jgi:UDP-glucose 4-epimerase
MRFNNKVLVFGGSGFLGSHVSDNLTKKGFDVTIFDKNKSKYLNPNQRFVKGDILNKADLDFAVKNQDIIFNFAGIADIDECHKNPIETIKYNILANAKIIESAIKNNVKKYLFSSSAYVYSSSGSFYRISKQTSELIIESYAEENNLKYTILRYGSLYGERANRKNSIHRIIEDAIDKKKIEYHGEGNEIREFIHVQDAAELSAQAIEKQYDNQILLLTGSKSVKYEELLVMINEIFHNKINVEMLPNKNKTHYKMSPYSFNPKLAKKLTSNPHIDLGQGLLNLIETIHKIKNQ